MDNAPLNKLPGELRNRISELALDRGVLLCIKYRSLAEKELGITSLIIEEHDPHDINPFTNPNMRALSETCKQLRQETKEMFWATNSFIVPLDQPRWEAPSGNNAKRLEPLADVLEFFKSAGIRNVHTFRIGLPAFRHGSTTLSNRTTSLAAAETAISMFEKCIVGRMVVTLRVTYIAGPDYNQQTLDIRLDRSRFSESCREGADVLLRLRSGPAMHRLHLLGRMLRDRAIETKQV